MKLPGAEVIIQCLLEQGVDTVFGFPGGAVISLYDALYDAPIHHVLTVHEQGAIHAADGYARSSGRPGVCIVTSGPGATNIVTGLATAYMDSVPLVAITGQVATSQIGRDSFQETDMISMSMAITKHNFLVTDPQQLAVTIRRAFKIAVEGRPGPVLIDIPSNIQTMLIDYEPLDESMGEKADQTEIREEYYDQILQAQSALQAAQRPVILVGGGVIRGNGSRELYAFAERCRAPVVSTLMGLGGFPGSDERFLGLTGMHGHILANQAIIQADVIIAVSSRLNERVTGSRSGYGNDKMIVHIDIDPSELDKNIGVYVGLVGDIRQTLTMLAKNFPILYYDSWWQEIRGWQEKVQYPKERQLTAPWIMEYLNQTQAGKPTVYVTDVGQNQIWAAQYLSIERPRSLIMSGGFGTMGFGLPAAIGSTFAQPDSQVIHIAGDGGFKMTGMELYTVAREQKRILSIVLDNQSLGMVRQWQTLFYNERYSQTLLTEFDFAQFAEVCGIQGMKAATQAEFVEAFQKAANSGHSAVIVAKIPDNQLVMPMMTPGGTLGDYVAVP
ncbi:acetolactate synthase-1/2/3 large subunit [Sporomusaceae bacterium BoRhaA]|uniref:biosynthetic-type acetolactate synthase large subunit n=1 Tax=Pelorhabdus rhamnosifermentans TaxID=2772457 RepID=UPI001C06445E|nr:biosynthetic-type acetolactate synthase large subunit [Pelorhabdus rhamnosifermentans]MBU2702504.1 acetolactate synthase-1/2/3 large subunit [Pelorhabdus rhamnosifermentans]